MVEEARRAFGRLDAVCNIGGIYAKAHSAEVPDEDWARMLLRVAACGLNFFDGLMVEGTHQTKPDLPFTPGSGRRASPPPPARA